jgi:hypothetical protein
MSPSRLSAALLCLTVCAAPVFSEDEAPDKAQLAAYVKTLEAYAKSEDPDERTWFEMEAEKEPPLPPGMVQPLADAFFPLLRKHGRKLKKSGTNYFYDKKTKKGLYLVSPGKKGGGLLISMHGGGEGSGSAGSAHGIWGSAKGNGFTVISPEVMRKVSSAWNEPKEEQMVLEIIEAAKRTFQIDTDRICLAGHSMGGDGSWMIGGRNADLFAACAPLAGSVMPYMVGAAKNRMETPLSDYQGLMEGVIPNLMWLPYHIHHSDDDRNEAVHPDDIATGYLKRLQKRWPTRYVHTYDRVTGIQHSLPSNGVKPIIKWLAKQRRKTYPREVIWETWWKTKNQMYWLYHPDPRDAWRFHARFEGTGISNHIEVSATTKPVQGRKEPKEVELTLLLSPKMVDFSKPLRVTCGEQVLFEGPIHRTLWALLTSIGRRNDPKQWFEGHVKVTIPRHFWKDLWDEEEE